MFTTLVYSSHPRRLRLAAVAALATMTAACAAPNMPPLETRMSRGQLVALDDTRNPALLPERFQGRWIEASERCRPDSMQSKAIAMQRDRLSDDGDHNPRYFQAVRRYSDYANAVEVEAMGDHGEPRLLFMQISPDLRFLKITKGGEKAVDTASGDEVTLLRTCPIGG